MENVRKIVLTVISKHLHCEVEQIFIFARFEWPSVLIGECFGLSIRC